MFCCFFKKRKDEKSENSLSIQPNTTNITHENVELTLSASDSGGSGVKRIQLSNGEWVQGAQAQYSISKNGTYTFKVEDNAGNVQSKSITITNIDKSIFMDQPIIQSFPSFTLKEKTGTISTSISPFYVKDWREQNNQWKLTLSSTPLINKKTNHVLPKGSVHLQPVSSITGQGNIPSKIATKKQTIDSQVVTIAESVNSRGAFLFDFPKNALEITVDPTTAKKRNIYFHSYVEYCMCPLIF